MSEKISSECSVCGEPEVDISYFEQDEFSSLYKAAGSDGRDRLMMRIMINLSENGKFSFGNTLEFWRQFDRDLCPSCQSTLRSLGRNNRIHEVLELLEKAVSMDPENETARQNLATVKGMI